MLSLQPHCSNIEFEPQIMQKGFNLWHQPRVQLIHKVVVHMAGVCAICYFYLGYVSILKSKSLHSFGMCKQIQNCVLFEIYSYPFRRYDLSPSPLVLFTPPYLATWGRSVALSLCPCRHQQLSCHGSFLATWSCGPIHTNGEQAKEETWIEYKKYFLNMK